MDIDSRVSRRSPTGVARAKADAVLRVLAGVSIALLIYEVWTLGRSVLLPLLANPNVLQTDFHYYYDAAIRFRADPSRLYQLSDDVIAGFTYPPPAILPFVMLSYLPLGVAMVVLTVSSYAVVILSMVLWIRSLEQRGVAVDRSNAIAVTLVAIALGPTYSNAIFGQVNAWVLICAIGFVTIGSTRPALGGTFLAAGTLLKIYPALMVALGVWDRSAWRRILYGTLAGVVIIAIALPFVPLSAYQTFSGDVLPARFDKTAVHISNQSLIAFIERFSIPPDRFLNWTGEQAIAVSGSVRAFNWLLGIAAIALLWRRATRGPRLDAIHSAAGLIALPAVIAPLGWGHTYVLVLPLIVLHLLQMRERSWLSTAAICACVIAMMVPSGRRFDFVEVLPAALQNFAYSRYLLATLILIALPPRRHLDHDIPS
jgi:alpha-1,2-mannosyltransferase